MSDVALPKKLPKLARHKGTGQACVYLNRRRIYLGPWPESQPEPSQEVLARYQEVLGDWIKNGGLKPPASARRPGRPGKLGKEM